MPSSALQRCSTLSIPAEPSDPPARSASSSGSEDTAVRLEAISKRFGKITALDQVSLLVRRGELLLDEPFSALDRNLRASMQVELKDIVRKLAVTTIFVTHDQSEALSLSDRIAVIAQGRIHQLGTPDEIYRRPADRFVASFVGDVNVLRARLER